jgi:hypothetical protein
MAAMIVVARPRANLASSYWQAGRTAEAIAIEEKVLADRVEVLGDRHPHTLSAGSVLDTWRKSRK